MDVRQFCSEEEENDKDKIKINYCEIKNCKLIFKNSAKILGVTTEFLNLSQPEFKIKDSGLSARGHHHSAVEQATT